MASSQEKRRRSGPSSGRNGQHVGKSDTSSVQVSGSFQPARPDRVSFGRIRSRRPRPPKLYRIGEVVEYAGMSRQTIHNYTNMGLLPENRWTSGGHRLYDESAFERLDLIVELKTRNKSLQDIRDYFVRLDAL